MKNFFLPSGMDEAGNIPGIYNYCNRICERCNFTTMCFSYKMMPSIIKDPDLDSPGPDFTELSESIPQPVELLLNHAEREYEDQTDDSWTEIKNQMDESDKIISGYEIIKKASEYFDLVREVFDILDVASGESGQDINSTIHNDLNQLSEKGKLDEFLELSSGISALSYVIFIKLRRAASGHFNFQQEEDDEFEEFDMNGSAKCVLVSIDESIEEMLAAKSYIPSLTEETSNLFTILVDLRSQTETFFPDARSFIRPGLDE